MLTYALFFSIAMLCDISTSTGIILDTVFTQKAVKGMLCEMKKTPDRFKGHRILFLHTGTDDSIIVIT